MSTPSNYFVSQNISKLFSFAIPPEADLLLGSQITRFELMRPSLNQLASKYWVNQQEILSDFQELGVQYISLEHSYLLFSHQEKKHFSRVALALYMLYSIANKLCDRDLAYCFLHNAIVSLEEIEVKSEETSWYLVCALRYKANFNNTFNTDLIRKTILCLENIQSIPHRKTIAYFVHEEYYPKLSEYPNYEPLRRLKELLPPTIPYRFDGHLAKLRHEFILKLISNQDYYNVVTSPLLSKTAVPIEKNLELIIPQETSILSKEMVLRITINQYDLFRFSAHIGAPSPPMLHVDTPELAASNKTEEFRVVLQKRHRTAGFCCGEGFLDLRLVEKKLEIFRNIVFDELIKFFKDKKIHHFSSDTEKTHYRRKFKSEMTLDFIKRELQRLDNIRKELQGFHPLNAVFLFYRSLTVHQYGLEPTLLQNIQHSVHSCLEILFQASEGNKLSHSEKHRYWLDMARILVDSLTRNPRHLLIQVGTPIKQSEIYSTHAFYIAVRHLPENMFQIIITNGGGEVASFHKVSPNQDSKDREEYCYAASEPFDIKACSEKLIQYLYFLISLAYRPSIQEDSENLGGPNTDFNLLKSVYLEKSFIGYGGSEIQPFIRRDLSETFLSQFTGNCTIHNLKKSLQILFNLDQINFGLLEDTLLIGLDQLISRTLNAQPTTHAIQTPTGNPILSDFTRTRHRNKKKKSKVAHPVP